MTHKAFARSFVFFLILISSIAAPSNIHAGGVCGGVYIVETGETFSSIAARCGTSVSIITAANPGVKEPLKTGQTLNVPGSTSGNAQIVTSTPTATYNYYPPVSYNGTYIVQYGDTFSGIASRYRISINDLWAANPYIQDINYLYAGQMLYIPASSSVIVPAPAEESVPLSYGTVSDKAPRGNITLSNKANGDVYVSLQGTTGDGTHVINEYPVHGEMQVRIPAGWYVYVAWVGGIKFEGQFKLGGDTNHTITFYASKVVVK
jgi:LysM repeat protein